MRKTKQILQLRWSQGLSIRETSRWVGFQALERRTWATAEGLSAGDRALVARSEHCTSFHNRVGGVRGVVEPSMPTQMTEHALANDGEQCLQLAVAWRWEFAKRARRSQLP